MAVKPVVYDDTTKKHRPLGSGEKMDGLSASSIVSSQSGNIITTGADGLAYATGSGIADPAADNLLETTPSGKLKMDVDRLSEWLDGHPADAKAFSEAVKVVSADSGNVITKGSDKGAYLAKGDISSAVSGMTDAQKQTLAAALADGTTVTASGGKLHAATQAGDAAQLADGKTIVASGGKLTADLSNATVAQKKAIANALAGSGLGVNSSTGKFDVDFKNMPTDKFEDMLKDMKMQIPLDSNRTLYVNGSTGNDTAAEADDTTPFKTIQACVDYATKNLAVGSHNVYIDVEGGMTYSEQVTLPMFTRTSGVMVLRARQDSNPPTIANPSAQKVGTPVSVTGGSWILHRINVTGTFSDPDDGNNHFPACVSADGGATSVTIRGCSLVSSYNSGAPAKNITIRHIAAYNGATVSLGLLAGYHNSLSVTPGQATGAYFLHSERFSRISIPSGNTASTGNMYDIACSGSCTYFVQVSTNSQIYVIGGGNNYQHFTGTVSGTQYRIANGSGVSAPNGGFPGTSTGNVLESSTYCWYEETGS